MSLSNLDSIKLRSLSDPTLTAKGSELTWDEEDENFVIIHDAISELANVEVSGVDPFDADTEYSTADPYVTYNGNTWQYINAIPQTGVTPGSDALTWSLVSNGLFTHQQNTDTILANGTADEVSAAEIRAFIDAGGSTDDSIYSALWNGVTTKSPSKNAVYDKIELLDAAKLDLSGGTMSGDIDMSSNDIYNIRTLSGAAGSIDFTGSDIVVEANLDLGSNNLINITQVVLVDGGSITNTTGNASVVIDDTGSIQASGNSVYVESSGGGATLQDLSGGGVYLNDAEGGGIYLQNDATTGDGVYVQNYSGAGIYLSSYNPGDSSVTASIEISNENGIVLTGDFSLAGVALSPGNSGAIAVTSDITALSSVYQPLDSDLTSWAGITRASGFDTFVATPTSANLASLVTDETGSGSLVFATSPSLVTPILGVASATSLSILDSTYKEALKVISSNVLRIGDGFSQVTIISSTDATSTANGAFRVVGGLSVAKKGVFGDSVTIMSTATMPFDAQGENFGGSVRYRITNNSTGGVNNYSSIEWVVKNDAGTVRLTSAIQTRLTTITAGDEVGQMEFTTWSSGALTTRLTLNNSALTISDGINIASGTTIGSKLWTATNQKGAFWNKTPIVQPTTSITGATRVGGAGAAITDTDTFGGYTLAQLAAILINTGLAE